MAWVHLSIKGTYKIGDAELRICESYIIWVWERGREREWEREKERDERESTLCLCRGIWQIENIHAVDQDKKM